MITTSEIAVTATIWILTATGAFFGTCAMVRRNRARLVRQESNTCKQGGNRSARELQ